MFFSEESKANWVLAVQALPALEAEFGPEEKAKSIVLRDLAERKIIICFQCKVDNEIPSTDARVFRCKKCSKEIWLTARTNYHRVRLFFARLAIIRFFEMGICLDANQAATLLKITNDTANRIYKQAGISVISRLPGTAVEVPSENALAIVSRRTTQTPALKPPFEEEFEMQKSHQGQNTQPISEGACLPGMPDLSELELLILEILSEKSMDFDQIVNRSQSESSALSSALTYLELRGLVETQPGTKFARAKSFFIKNANSSEKAKAIAESFNYFVKNHFQGIGRKYTQVYSCLYWLANDRETWQINSLRKLFASHPYVSYQDILDFVTPLSFKIVPRFNTS
ncbi:MAG: hypothetical protein IT342_08770 [Candidatus Melainabacteria bacterium]|nr:hypothetical protein [Candidatus Melainabacteria bacterium]